MRGYTLNELLIVLAIFVIVIVAIFSFLLTAQRVSREGGDMAEINQSGRMIFKKITRELRQAREIVTELPAAVDSEIPINATDSIEFEDGQEEELYYYIRYFKEENEVKREVKRYYFPSNPGEFLPWDAISSEEELFATTIEGPIVIGGYVSDLKFWGEPVVNVLLSLKKGEKEADYQTKVFGRNL